MNKLIVIQTENKLKAVFLENDVVNPLSIDGNAEVSYSTDNADAVFSRLQHAVVGTFNLESLDGADISIILVSCGADTNITNKLYKVFLTVKESNVIYAEHILPYILLGAGKLKKQGNQSVQILDTYYHLEYHEQKLSCVQCEKQDEIFTVLDVIDFAQLLDFDINRIGPDEVLSKQIVELQKQLQNKNEKISEFSRQVEKNKSSLKKAKHDGMVDIIKFFKEYIIFDKYYYLDDAANNPDILQAFIDAGVDIDEKDKDGNTALMRAVKNNNYQAVKILIQNGANPRKKNNDYASALSLAGDDKKMVNIFEDAEAQR
jgi:hypothetical protein